MADVADRVLLHVAEHGATDSFNLAQSLDVDHQKIVGAIKSIQSFGDVSVRKRLAPALEEPWVSVWTNGNVAKGISLRISSSTSACDIVEVYVTLAKLAKYSVYENTSDHHG